MNQIKYENQIRTSYLVCDSRVLQFKKFRTTYLGCRARVSGVNSNPYSTLRVKLTLQQIKLLAEI